MAALTAAFLIAGTVAVPSRVYAQEAPAAEEAAAPEAAAPAEPTLDQRVADLEAYINNVARTPDVASKVNVPGPGHNAWQMASTALVLFMTLPGLALFYGGLVRVKNILSILAMCMGIAGLVSILWWLCGYSLTFGGTNPFIGDLSFAMFKGMSPGLFPARSHGLVDKRLHVRTVESECRHQGHRLRGWHRRAYVIGLDRSRIVPYSRTALRLWQGADASTFDGALHDRHGNALRGLVRF